MEVSRCRKKVTGGGARTGEVLGGVPTPRGYSAWRGSQETDSADAKRTMGVKRSLKILPQVGTGIHSFIHFRIPSSSMCLTCQDLDQNLKHECGFRHVQTVPKKDLGGLEDMPNDMTSTARGGLLNLGPQTSIPSPGGTRILKVPRI